MKVYLTERTPSTMLTTESTITFPIDKTGKQFDSRLYTVALTDGKASTKEVKKALAELTTTLDPIVHECGAYQWWSGSIPVVLILIFIWLLQYTPNELGISQNTFLVIGCVIFIGIFVTCKWCSIAVGGKSREVYTKMREECQTVIEKYNKDLAERGLRWHLPEDFPEYVELWKDYKLEGFEDEKIEIDENENKEGGYVDIEKGLSGDNVAIGDESRMGLNHENESSPIWLNNDSNNYVPPSN